MFSLWTQGTARAISWRDQVSVYGCFADDISLFNSYMTEYVRKDHIMSKQSLYSEIYQQIQNMPNLLKCTYFKSLKLCIPTT